MANIDLTESMTRAEKRAASGLAAIFGLRMLGMCLILPVFALYAEDLPGGDNHTLVGLALGMYGLTQALLMLPFGMASDRIGRKPVLLTGLLLAVIGFFPLFKAMTLAANPALARAQATVQVLV